MLGVGCPQLLAEACAELRAVLLLLPPAGPPSPAHPPTHPPLQINLHDAVRRTISLSAGGKTYRLKDKVAVMLVRPRG